MLQGLTISPNLLPLSYIVYWWDLCGNMKRGFDAAGEGEGEGGGGKKLI